MNKSIPHSASGVNRSHDSPARVEGKQPAGAVERQPTPRTHATRSLTRAWPGEVMSRPLRTLVACLALPVLAASAPVIAQERLWDDASAACDQGDYALALAEYEQLAQQGDARAAQIAGEMLYFGEALYGTQVRQDRRRAAMLMQQAAVNGRPEAGLLLKRINVSQVSGAASETTDTWSEPSPFAAVPPVR
jgi:hypothetical protein